jgi:hypothetical protein
MDVIRAGALPESERVAAATHLEACSTCRVLLEANVSLPGSRNFSVYSPLLLVAGLSLGAIVLAQCGGPAGPPNGTSDGSGGTEVAKAPGNGAEGPTDDAAPAGGETENPPTKAVKLAPHVATPPGKKPEPAALPGTPALPPRSGTPADPRVRPPQGGLEAGSGKTEGEVAQPGQPSKTKAEAPRELPEVPGPRTAPVDPNAGSEHPVAPAPPKSGAGAPVLPPTVPNQGDPMGPRIDPKQPGNPAGPKSGDNVKQGPTAPNSPDQPEPKAAPAGAAGAAVPSKNRTENSLEDQRKLLDTSLGAGSRAKAAKRLGKAKAGHAVPALLDVARKPVALKLRRAAIEALAEIGDPAAVSGLQKLLSELPLDDLDLPAAAARALRRLGAQSYLEQRAARELSDFAPRVRARGALIAAGAESLAAASRLIELLADRAVVNAGATHIDGERVPEAPGGVEVRHVAWLALLRVDGQQANYGFDADDWRGWLKRRIAQVGAPVAVPAPATTAKPENVLSPELRAAAPELLQVLDSRDGSVVEAFVQLLGAHTDFTRLATPPGDIHAPLAKQLGKFESAAARDAFLASFYVAVFVDRGELPEGLAERLAGAGKAGRTAYVARMGAPGVQRLVVALEATVSDPAAQYGAGGQLLRMLDAFRGTAPKRPFLESAGKDLDAQAADAELFRSAVSEYGKWWRGLGVPHWDRAGGRIIDGD